MFVAAALLAVISVYGQLLLLSGSPIKNNTCLQGCIVNQMHALSADMAYGKTCTAAAYLPANLAILQERRYWVSTQLVMALGN